MVKLPVVLLMVLLMVVFEPNTQDFVEGKTYKFFWPNTAATKLESLKGALDNNYQYGLAAGGIDSPFPADTAKTIARWGQISDVDPSAGTISIVLTGPGAAALSEKNLSFVGETFSLSEIPDDQFGLWVEARASGRDYIGSTGLGQLLDLEKIELVE